MAPELSSNWKKLKAKIKAESTAKPSVKRKAAEISEPGTENPRTKRGKPNSGKTLPRREEFSTAAGSSKRRQTPQMGNTQSSKIDNVPTRGVAPSLALWAEENDISPEDIAEAYGLGIKQNAMVAEEPARPNEGLAPNMEVGKYIAMDCEMVGVGEGGHDSVLGRVSIVDFHGRQVYDSFVRPTARVTDWRTAVSGISPRNMATARNFDEVQAQVADLLKGRILVGHDIKHDLEVLMLDHPVKSIRDTAKFPEFKKYGHGPKPALKVLAREILGIEIQTGQHSSIEDARVTMLLFRKQKPAFDVDHMNRFPDAKPVKLKGHGKKSGKKAKKKRNA